MSIICVIPARLNSTRFPKKMLAPLLGKPLLQWTWEAACRVSFFDQVLVATDSLEIARVVGKFGGKVVMTSPACASGTDRLIELQNSGIKAALWVNWQGDEPFLNAQAISDLLQTWQTDGAEIWTLKKRILSAQELSSPHIAKVVCDAHGFALYFSRAPIPFVRDPQGPTPDFFKHIGIYAFSDAALRKLAPLKPAPLELAEQLEQLRFLTHGLRIRVHETTQEPFGIDLPEHLVHAEALARHQNPLSRS